MTVRDASPSELSVRVSPTFFLILAASLNHLKCWQKCSMFVLFSEGFRFASASASGLESTSDVTAIAYPRPTNVDIDVV